MLFGVNDAGAATIDGAADGGTVANDSRAETTGTADSMAEEQVDLAVQQYLQKIQELEFNGGVYQPDLAETLAGLGAIYLEQGNHSGAEETFQRALHNSRVNDGLYNQNQLPILEQLISLNTFTRDWPDLDQNYSYLYWLSKRNYGPNDPRLLPVIDRIGRWHLHAYAYAGDGQQLQHLQVADNLYGKFIQIVETHYGANDPRLVNALYGVALTSYQMAVLASDAEKFNEIRNGQGSAFNSGRRELLQEARSRDDLMLSGFVRGKNAMERVVAIHEANSQLSPEARAVALVHLADWYLLFNKWNSSQETYSQAYKVLTDRGLPTDEIDGLFAQPRSLPAFLFPENEREEQASAEEEQLDENQQQAGDEVPTGEVPYVLLSFDVSRSGTPRNIQVIESSPPDSISLQRKAKQNIGKSKFRPRLSKGVAVDATGIRRRYLFPEQ